jgi:Reverse transcriptase (RNA-dependent DNA polymerase)
MPKPNKPDYTSPRAYRPIRLLECLGKILEKLLANSLKYYAFNKGMISLNHFGGRVGFSTTDTRLAVLHELQSTKNTKLVSSILTFNFKGYYSHIDHNILI